LSHKLAKPFAGLLNNLPTRSRWLRRSSERDFAAGNYASGFAKLLELARSGDAASCYRLATCYEQGKGTWRNFAQAILWYEKAAQQGMLASMVRLGELCLTQRETRDVRSSSLANTRSSLVVTIDRPTIDANVAKGTYWNQRATTAGSAEAQSSLAFQYVSGLGVSRDLTVARALLENSAAQGYVIGQLGLGLLLAADTKAEGAKDRAIELLRAAARQGNTRAKFALAHLLLQQMSPEANCDEVVGLLLELATGDNTEAMYQLGEVYRMGIGVEQDLRFAETWLRRACTRGHLHAHTSLDQLLSTQLVPPRLDEAATIVRHGAELEDPRCQIRIAEMCLTGQGTLLDTMAAAYWLRKAGAHGYVLAEAVWEKTLYGYGNGRRWLEKPRLIFFDYAIETAPAPHGRT